MNIKDLLKRHRALSATSFFLAVVILMNSVLFLGYVFPQETRRDQMALQWEKSRKDLSRLHALGRAEVQLQEWRGLLTPKQGFSELLSSLSKLAKKQGIDIPSITYQQEDLERNGLLKISFSLKIVSPYYKVRKFIYSLETEEDFLLIEDLVIKKLGKKGNWAVEADLKVSAFLTKGKDA